MKASRAVLLASLLLAPLLRAEDETLQVIVLFRNGARFPMFGPIFKFLPTEVQQNLRFPKGLSEAQKDAALASQLSGNGVRQMYLLGRKLKTESSFRDFLAKEVVRLGDVHVLAAHARKNVDSAQVLMFGLLGEALQSPADPKAFDTPFDRPRFPWVGGAASDASTPLPKGAFHFPVHSVDARKDKVFNSFEESSCQGFNNFSGNLVQSKTDFIGQFKDLVQGKPELKDAIQGLADSGLLERGDSDPLGSAKGVYYLTDYLEAMRALGKQFFPDDASGSESADWRKLLKLSDYLKSLYFFEQKAMTVQLNYLIRDIRSKVKAMFFHKGLPYPFSNNELYQKAKGSADHNHGDPFHKLAVYSAHDVNIWALLNNFGLTKSGCLLDKIHSAESAPEDFACQGNPGFSSNLSLVLKKPAGGEGEGEGQGSVYIGGSLSRGVPGQQGNHGEPHAEARPAGRAARVHRLQANLHGLVFDPGLPVRLHL